MRISTLSLVIALSGTVANAQVTITQNEMPHAGDNLFRTQAVLNPLLNYNNTGPNTTWNFNNLVADGQDSRSYQTVGSTNIVYSLVYADIFLNSNRANHVTEGMDVPFYDLLPIENPYTFYYRSANVYRKVGYGAEVAGFPIPITMDQQDVIYQLPLNFGNTSTSNSSYDIAVPTLAYYGYRQQRVNVVDGWGTVNTPAGSFNALRVKTTIAGRDTIQVDEFSLGFAIERPLITEYKWLSPGRRVPVLQINTVTLFGAQVITEIFFYDEERTLTVVPPLANNFCPGDQLQVNYTKTGVFNQGGFLVQANVFRAQLSDATGSFANPINIGSVTSNQSGSINATIPTNTPPGTGYRIRVIATNPSFVGTSNSFNITIGTTPQAIATAAGPVEFCAGSSVVLNAATAVGNNYQWQLGGADLPGATAATLDVAATGSYQVVVSTTCGTATSAPVSVVVNALPEHELVAPTDLSTCAGVPVPFSGTDLSGQSDLTYQWLLDGQPVAGATNADLSSADAGSYSLLITNAITGCTYTTNAAVLVVETVPVPNTVAVGPTTVCDGTTVQLEASGADGSTYQWYLNGEAIAGAGEAELGVAVTGSYTAIATSVSGCASEVSTAIQVTVDPLPTVPTVNALGATTFCAGGDVTLVATGDADVAWQWYLDGAPIQGATGSELIVVASGAYGVMATNAFGCAVEAAVPVDVVVDPTPQTPSVVAADAVVFCDGGDVTLIASGADGATYQWYLDGEAIAGADDTEFSATLSGSYTAIATNATGCSSDVSASIQVTVHPLPTVPTINALGATTFCAGGDVTLVVTGDADVAWQWYLNGAPIQGATDIELTIAASGAYGIMATNAFGCVAEAAVAVEVVVNPIPPTPAVVAADAVVFCDGGAVTLIASGANGATYQWTLDGNPISGANLNQYQATVGGNYAAVTVTAAGCTSPASNTIAVTVNDLPTTPVATASGPTAFCAGASVGLVATGDAGSGFEWYLNGTAILGAGGSGYTANAAGSYTAIAMDANGCASAPSNTIEVEVEPLPVVPTLTALDATVLCEGGAVVIVAASDAGASFQWYFNGAAIAGATDAQYVANASGAYSAMAISASGCTSAGSWPTVVTVNALPAEPTLTASGPTAFCDGDNVELIATADAGVVLQWSADGEDIDGANAAELIVTTSGAYAVTATDANGCSSASGIAMVFANPIPEPVAITASGSTTICAGNTVALQAGIAPGISYQWYLDGELLPGATSQTYAASMPGVHTVVAVSAEGCSADASNSIAVTVDPLPNQPLITLTESPVFCEGSSTTMVATADPGVTYQWIMNGENIPGATASQHTVSTAGEYTLVITDANGCSATAVEGPTVVVNALPNAPTISLNFDVLSASGPGTFQWSFNGVPIPGATNADLTATSNGVYTVTTTNADGCSATSDPFTVSSVGIVEAAGTGFNVYPNPNNGQFTIQLGGVIGSSTLYTVHDATGRVVKQGSLVSTATVVELPDARAGMYFLHVVQNGVNTTHRIVVAR